MELGKIVVVSHCIENLMNTTYLIWCVNGEKGHKIVLFFFLFSPSPLFSLYLKGRYILNILSLSYTLLLSKSKKKQKQILKDASSLYAREADLHNTYNFEYLLDSVYFKNINSEKTMLIIHTIDMIKLMFNYYLYILF